MPIDSVTNGGKRWGCVAVVYDFSTGLIRSVRRYDWKFQRICRDMFNPPNPRLISHMSTSHSHHTLPPPAPSRTHTRHSGVPMRSGFNLYHYGNQDKGIQLHKMSKPKVDLVLERSRELATHFSKLRVVMKNFSDPNPNRQSNFRARPREDVKEQFDREYETLIKGLYSVSSKDFITQTTVRRLRRACWSAQYTTRCASAHVHLVP